MTSATQPTQPEFDAPERVAPVVGRPSVLDRGIDLTNVSAMALAWVVVSLTAIAFRLVGLDRFALSISESQRAFDGWALYSGAPLNPGETLPVTAPLILLLESLGFFLFGATDATARVPFALMGLAAIPLIALLRPFIGGAAALGMAILVALSPTLVFASRAVDPGIVIVTCALLTVVAVARAGLPGSSVRRWAAVAGAGLGLMLGSGPTAISVIIALAVGGIVAMTLDGTPNRIRSQDDERKQTRRTPVETGAIRGGLDAIVGTYGGMIAFVTGLVVTILVVFTRLFSDLSALEGVVRVFTEWGRFVGTGTAATPVQFFLLAALLYEGMAIILAVVAIATIADGRPGDPETGALGWGLFAGWFATALILFAFSNGRGPEHAVHVALPLALLGGLGLGHLIARVDWRDVVRGASGLLLLTVLGIIAGLVAVAVLTGQLDSVDASERTQAIVQIGVVAVAVVGGLVFVATSLILNQNAAVPPRRASWIVLLAVLVVSGAITVRSTTGLAYYNLASGTELLAQEQPTESVRSVVTRLRLLSRDVSVDRTSVRDPTGRYGLSITVDSRVEWPFRWYFREFNDVQITTPGRAPETMAEVVIAPDDLNMAESGYTTRSYPYMNRVPAAYTSPDIGEVILGIVNPANWIDSLDYLLFRELEQPAPATTLVVGYDSELTARLFPGTQVFNLFADTQPGNALGQLNGPRGIVIAPSSQEIYVVDSLNARVQRFAPDGDVITAWGGPDDVSGVEFELFVIDTAAGQPPAVFGPTGIALAPEGVIYVADTWGHRIVGISPEGAVVRQIGSPGERADTGDGPGSVETDPGLFFGPRAVAVANDEIYVVDTGNERVQVFGLDGTFRRAFGGFGQEPGQLIEPVGIAIGADGAVYVADSGNGRVSVFDADGSPRTQWPVEAWAEVVYNPETGSRPGFEPNMAFGPDGLLYVTSRISGSILVYDVQGQLITEITDVGGVALVGPVGIAFDPDGLLYVSDADLNAVLPSDAPVAIEGQPEPPDGTPAIQLPVGTGSTPAAPASDDTSQAPTPDDVVPAAPLTPETPEARINAGSDDEDALPLPSPPATG